MIDSYLVIVMIRVVVVLLMLYSPKNK